MAHQVTLTLSDDEYSTLARDAADRAVPIELIIHELITLRLSASTRPVSGVTSRAFLEQQYREGKVANAPTQRPLRAEETAERERLAEKLAGGMPASEMAIEDRGPR